ncbi:MAG TPA: HDOD domain-containing protein [Telluria sp.]|nr:HDOD domain-containing protein [Telluria sp.]
MSAVPIEDVVRDIRELPALPSVVLELIETFDKPEVDIATLADKISRDQALAAKTLRLANSSFYGLSAKVKTVNQAIVVLGFDSVRALVSAGGIIDHFQGGGGPVDATLFWRHAIATALCSRHLARATRQNQDHAFIAGLLHDIGELVLATRFSAPYQQALDLAARSDCGLLKAEQEVLGIDHQRVGLVLAQAWRFPDMIGRAIAHHHAPQHEDLGRLPAIVHVADAIVDALDLLGNESTLVPQLQDNVWDSLALEPAQLRAVFRDTELQFEEACQILAP